MARQTYANVGHVLLKRGNTVQSTSYTGPLGELTINTDTLEVRIHDNTVAGGHPIIAGGGNAITGATGTTRPKGDSGTTGAPGDTGTTGARGPQGDADTT